MKIGEKHGAGSARWAVWDRQFDLTRTDSGETYLTRWWIVKTPVGGIALHRMMSDDARDTVHTHPFSFVSIPIVGGYVEKRLDPKTMLTSLRAIRWKRSTHPGRIPRFRANVMRAGLDAHTITALLRVPTYTVLLVGPHRGTWGFLEAVPPLTSVSINGEPFEAYAGEPLKPVRPGYGGARWRWTRHDRFDSGHYAPEKAGRRR